MINIVGGHNNEENDSDGEATMTVLMNVRKIAYLLNSNNASSLGLHPAVYFYSQEGLHKSASFLAITDFASRLRERKKLNDFISVRPRFERFILEYDYLVQQINRKYRTAQASYPHISRFLECVVDALKTGMSDTDIINEIQLTDEFSHLSLQKPDVRRGGSGRKFDTEAKSTVYLREVLTSAPKCKICGGYIHRNSISFDHVERKRDGGSSSPENGQLAHPYCNTGFKN